MGQKEVTLKYNPANDMIADAFTKQDRRLAFSQIFELAELQAKDNIYNNWSRETVGKNRSTFQSFDHFLCLYIVEILPELYQVAAVVW